MSGTPPWRSEKRRCIPALHITARWHYFSLDTGEPICYHSNHFSVFIASNSVGAPRCLLHCIFFSVRSHLCYAVLFPFGLYSACGASWRLSLLPVPSLLPASPNRTRNSLLHRMESSHHCNRCWIRARKPLIRPTT